MEAIKAFVQTPEFAAVKAALLDLDPAFLVDPRFGAHLLAMRTGLTGLEGRIATLAVEEPATDEPQVEEPENDPPAEE